MAFRSRPRTQSIKTKIAILLFVPLASLLGLWGFAASTTLGDALTLVEAKTFDDKLITPTQHLVTELQHERRMSMAQLGGDAAADRSGFDAQRVKTDKAMAEYAKLSAAGDLQDQLEPELQARARRLSLRLGEIGTLRRGVDRGTFNRPEALEEYSSLIDVAFEVYGAITPKDAVVTKDADTLADISRARELVTREDALVTGALSGRRFTQAERDQFVRLVGAHRIMYDSTTPSLDAEGRQRFQQLASSAGFLRFQALEDRIARETLSRGRINVEAGTWHTIAESVIGQLEDFETQTIKEMTDRATGIANDVILRLVLAAGLGLIAIIVSGWVAWRVSRRLIRESREMATAVSDFTGEYLPALADTIRTGGQLDAAAALPQLNLTVTEIDRIGDSFTEAGRAVIEATAREVQARRAVNEVFVTLARRNQALLHRQLSMLDTMERRTEEPTELADLFRLDHLATRMRRHAEGLVILAGKTAGRAWRNPVPLVDVVRGASAEVEDYTRVRVLPMPGAALAGSAVADTIHLLAELIENATLFSPPDSPVQITGQPVPNGFALEIEDRGLGLKPETLADINARLEDPPEFDLTDLNRLGLIVVAKLAGRHDISVALRGSPYGGTTAIVLLPSALIVEAPANDRAPAQAIERVSGLDSVRAAAGPERALAAAVATSDTDWQPVRVRQPEPEPEPTPEPVEAAEESGELPRRRRQTNLVPQLLERIDEDEQVTAPQPANGHHPNGTGGNGAAPEATDAGDDLGLPRRRRQESLAPQLRDEILPYEEQEPDLDRPPEDLKARMAAMQRGWQRGRADAEQVPARSGTEEDST